MIFAATATARRARPEALLCIFLWLISSRRTVDAAGLALALIRHGEAQVVADLEIRMIEGSRMQDVRDMVAVLLAKGHAAEVVQVSLCIVWAGHAEAVAQIKVSLVDSGGLSLACEAQNAMLALDEMALAEVSHVLVRMGRVDVAARMIILLVDSGRVGVVCKWLESIDRRKCRETLLQLSLAIGRMKRSDVDAAEVALMALELSKDYEDSAPTEAYVLLLRGGHAEVWAAIMHEIITMGHADVAARRTALIIKSGRPNLAGEGMRALTRIDTPKPVPAPFIWIALLE
ncbi:g3826 [Coccomyxa elongata]